MGQPRLLLLAPPEEKPPPPNPCHCRKSLRAQRELGLRHQKLVEDAQKNRQVAVKFLKASLGRWVPCWISLPVLAWRNLRV